MLSCRKWPYAKPNDAIKFCSFILLVLPYEDEGNLLLLVDYMVIIQINYSSTLACKLVLPQDVYVQ